MNFVRRSVLGLLLTVAGSVWAQTGTLVYSTNPQYPPYHWAVGGVFAGASVELLKLVLPEGLEAVPQVLPWKRALEMAKAGRVDLLLSLRITPERASYLTFTSHRAFPNPIVVFARADRGLTLTSWADLKGHTGGVSLGDTFGGGFDEYLKAELSYEIADTMVENFRKLDAGRIEWFVTSRYLGQAYLATHRLQSPIVMLSPAISTEDIHFGFSKLSPWAGLEPLISRRLAELDEKGVLLQLLERNLTLLTSMPAGTFPGE